MEKAQRLSFSIDTDGRTVTIIVGKVSGDFYGNLKRDIISKFTATTQRKHA